MANITRLADLNQFPKAQELVRAVFSGKYRVIVYGGAVRGGKSFNLLMCLVLLARKYPGIRAAIVRKDMETLRRNTLPTCTKVFPSRFMPLVNRSSYVWKCKNELYADTKLSGSVFFFGENYDKDKELKRWDGLEVNYFVLDQLEELTEDAFSKAIERAGSYFIPGLPLEEQPQPLILASCNPTKNWVKRNIFDKYTAGTLPDDWLYIPASIKDNPHVPQSYRDSLETLRYTSPNEYVRRVDGDWNYLEGENFLFEQQAVHDMWTNDYVSPGIKCITADIALKGSDKFVIGVWNGWRLEYVEWHDKTDGKQVLDKIKLVARRFRIPFRNICYDADGLGAYLGGWLKTSYSFKATAAPIPPPGSPKGFRPNYESLKAQCADHAAEKVNEDLVYVVPGHSIIQEHLVGDLESFQQRDRDRDGPFRLTKKEVQKKALGRSPDFGDMFIQRSVFDLRPRRRPRNKVG